MSQTMSLAERIDAEFAAAEEKIKQLNQRQIEEYRDRLQRIETFERRLEERRDIWRTRLETLAARFADRVKVTPQVTPGRRQAIFEVQSELARVLLKFSVAADEEVRNVVFRYDLDILPIFMKFDSHSELQVPLDNLDEQVIGQWMDERIVSFVRAYLSLHQNSHYLKDHLVEDPIAKVKFPKFAAGAKIESGDKTTYFISEETKRQFAQRAAAGR